MMKKVSIYSSLLVMVTVSILSTSVFAQTKTATSSSTPTVKPTLSEEDKTIQDFKDKIATKVAEIMKLNLRATAGTVTKVDKTLFVIKNASDTTYTIRKDDTITRVYQISGVTKKEIPYDDIEKGDYAIVSGPDSDQQASDTDRTITANVVYLDEQFIVKSGKVTEVDTTDSHIKVLSSEKDNITLDIDTTVRLQLVNTKTSALEAMTLTKVKEGDTIHFVYTKTGEEKVANRFDAFRVLIIPQEYFQK